MPAEPYVDVSSRSVGVALSTHRPAVIPVLALGLALSTFLALSFVLCVLSYLLFPSLPVAHGALSLVLPGFQLLTFPSFLLGLIESFGWGWYVALIFAPLFNYFVTRFGRTRA